MKAAKAKRKESGVSRPPASIDEASLLPAHLLCRPIPSRPVAPPPLVSFLSRFHRKKPAENFRPRPGSDNHLHTPLIKPQRPWRHPLVLNLRRETAPAEAHRTSSDLISLPSSTRQRSCTFSLRESSISAQTTHQCTTESSPTPGRSQFADYVHLQDEKFKRESLRRRLRLIRRGLEKNRQVLFNQRQNFQREVSGVEAAHAARRETTTGNDLRCSMLRAADSSSSIGCDAAQNRSSILPTSSSNSQQCDTPIGGKLSPQGDSAAFDFVLPPAISLQTSRGEAAPRQEGSLCFKKVGSHQGAKPGAVAGRAREEELNSRFRILSFLGRAPDVLSHRHQLRQNLRNIREQTRNDSTLDANDHHLLRRRFRLREVLGEGSYAAVRLADRRDAPGQRVAIKIYRRAQLFTTQRQESLETEIDILQSVSHPNIVAFHEVIRGRDIVFLVMEYVSRRSLQDHLCLGGPRAVGEGEAAWVFRQLCQAVSYLHERDIVHRDIKLQNVLLARGQVTKLIDFGFAARTRADVPLVLHCGTPSYMAPEVVARRPYNGKPADMWALGCLLYRMVCGCFPFRGATEDELFATIERGEYERPSNASPMLCDLLRVLLHPTPERRATAHHALQHVWLQPEPKATHLESKSTAEGQSASK